MDSWANLTSYVNNIKIFLLQQRVGLDEIQLWLAKPYFESSHETLPLEERRESFQPLAIVHITVGESIVLQFLPCFLCKRSLHHFSGGLRNGEGWEKGGGQKAWWMLWKSFSAGTLKLNVLVSESTSMRNRQSPLDELPGNAVNQWHDFVSR